MLGIPNKKVPVSIRLAYVLKEQVVLARYGHLLISCQSRWMANIACVGQPVFQTELIDQKFIDNPSPTKELRE